MNLEALRAFEKHENKDETDKKLRYRPSATDQWISCGAAPYLSKGIEEEKRPYAEEGTMAHALAESMYYQEFYGLPIVRDKFVKEYPKFAHCYDEMFIHATGYVNAIKDIKEGIKKGIIPLGKIVYEGVEKDVFIGEGKYGECCGQIDYVLIGEKGCLILDFKYGKGRKVNPDTSQIKTYLAGLLPLYDKNHDNIRMIASIYQPRISDIYAMHTYSHQDVDHHGRMINTILNLDPSSAKAFPGSHCFWCKAGRTKDQAKRCKAKDNVERDNLFDSLSGLLPNVKKKSRTEMAKDFLSVFPAMLKLYNELQSEFQARVEGGEKIQGVRIETKLGRRGWVKRPKAEMKQLFASAYPGVDLFQMVEKQRTITEIERQLKTKLSPEFVQATQSTSLIVDGEAELDVASMFDKFDKKG